MCENPNDKEVVVPEVEENPTGMHPPIVPTKPKEEDEEDGN